MSCFPEDVNYLSGGAPVINGHLTIFSIMSFFFFFLGGERVLSSNYLEKEFFIINQHRIPAFQMLFHAFQRPALVPVSGFFPSRWERSVLEVRPHPTFVYAIARRISHPKKIRYWIDTPIPQSNFFNGSNSPHTQTLPPSTHPKTEPSLTFSASKLARFPTKPAPSRYSLTHASIMLRAAEMNP